MTIHLPKDVENSINAQVLSGLFASPDDAIAEAWRHFIQRSQPQATPPSATPADPLLGIWRDDPEEIDEIVAEAMQRRRDEPWRDIAGE
jgi:Arc/MetJ-type ribon-helix-helix transcriptional regulator